MPDRRRKRPNRTVLLLALLLGWPAAAQQVDLTRRPVAAGTEFAWRFRDAAGSERRLAWRLADERRALARPLPPIDGPEANARLDAAWTAHNARVRAEADGRLAERLSAFAARLPDGVVLRLGGSAERRQVELEDRSGDRARLAAAMQALDGELAQARAQEERNAKAAAEAAAPELFRAVYRPLHYVPDARLGGRLRPDYAALAHRDRAAVAPLARAIGAAAGPDRQARLALALTFVQSLPYDDTPARGGSEAFLPPLAVLAENRGDCDSKATLLAALLAELLPERAAALLLLSDHAVLALPAEAGEEAVALTVAGRAYLALEAAGPGLLPPGRLGGRSRAGLAADGVLAVIEFGG